MNNLRQLQVRARLIAQLTVALVASVCLPLLSWGRGAFSTVSPHTMVETCCAAAFFAAPIIILTVATILMGCWAFPLIYRRRGPLVWYLTVPITVPSIIFGTPFPSIVLAVFPFLGSDRLLYCFAAALAASAGWDFWAAFHIYRSAKAIPAFLWILLGESILLYLNWFELYFE